MLDQHFIDERGALVHPGKWLKSYMEEHEISVDYIWQEYQLDVRPIILSSSRRWIYERGARIINQEEAGKLAELTRIPPGLFIKGCVDYYRAIGL